MKRHYHLELRCPTCGGESDLAICGREPPERVCCGDCLMERMDVVEMAIVRCTVIPGESQEAVDLFHHINFQRSTLQ